jgi:cell division protein FtsA
MEELFDLIKNELIRSKTIDAISSGIVITGGSSMLNGAVELAESIFDTPVRLGLPRDIDGLLQVIENPRYATGVGLLKMGKEDKDKDTNLHLDGNTITNILKKMKLWFQGNF